MLSRFISYIQESRFELKRVNWPTRAETIRLTLVVVVMSVATAVFLGSLDLILGFLLKTFIL